MGGWGGASGSLGGRGGGCGGGEQKSKGKKRIKKRRCETGWVGNVTEGKDTNCSLQKGNALRWGGKYRGGTGIRVDKALE